MGDFKVSTKISFLWKHSCALISPFLLKYSVPTLVKFIISLNIPDTKPVDISSSLLASLQNIKLNNQKEKISISSYFYIINKMGFL